MKANEYQKRARKTAIYRDTSVKPAAPEQAWAAIAYCALKLNGESGEVAEHVGKALRDDDFLISEERATALFKEIGDVQWYIANLCTELGFKLEDVMEYNLVKLEDRQKRNVLQGSGSDR